MRRVAVQVIAGQGNRLTPTIAAIRRTGVAMAGLARVRLRRATVVGAVLAAGFLFGGTALGAPAPGPTPTGGDGPPKPTAKTLCTVSDTKLTELSGLAVTDDGYVAMNDGNESSSRERIFFLDKSCKVQRSVGYSGGGALDPEDLAVAKDGTIWVADTGDDPLGAKRKNVALWRLAPGATTTTIFRLSFPEGEAHDAEALLLDANDAPIIITKDAAAPSKLYSPTGPLAAGKTVPMKLLGEFKPSRTGSGTLGLIGQLAVTGAANSPDRSKVALRTYSDAYEWDVPDGDVVKAITTGKPRITPLSDDEFGEAIAYAPDGSFVTISDVAQLPGTVKPVMRQYTPATTAEPSAPANAGGQLPIKRNSLSWYEELSLQQITMLVAALGALGLILVVAGVFGIRRARRRTGRGAPPVDQHGALASPVADDYGNSSGVYRSSGTVYGSNPGTTYGAPADPYDQQQDYPPQDYPPQDYDEGWYGDAPGPQQGYGRPRR